MDEAESAVNALTILQHGLPVDSYLGLPLYENTLVKPWPGNPEYEFRDISYSDRGLAVYHQWLPLYAIAASFRLSGVEPGRAAHAVRDTNALRKRTLAARLPAALVSVLLLPLLYIAARAMAGPAAAWAALIVGAATPSLIWYGRQARYYSFTVFASVLCVYGLWRVWRFRGGRDFILAGFGLALLFHTHLLTFFTAALAALPLSILLFLKHPALRTRVLALWGAVAAASVPWAVLSGFLATSFLVPSGWRVIDLPGDLWEPLRVRLPYVLGLAAAYLFLARRTLSLPARTAAGLLAAWVALSFLGFHLLMPAASQFQQRMTVGLVGPAALLTAIVLAHSARTLRGGTVASACVAVILMLAGDRVEAAMRLTAGGGFPAIEALVRHFEAEPPSGARLYAAPNEHLVMTFYTGRPFQSIAPVRREFLDCHPGPVFFVSMPPVPVPRRERARRTALPMLRGYPIETWRDWWQIFCYRFVGPEARTGARSNFQNRLGALEGTPIDGTGWRVYRSDQPAASPSCVPAPKSS